MLELEIDGLFNTRANSRVQPWIVRSAAPDGLLDSGLEMLYELGITDVLDLREPGEGGPRMHGLPVHSVPLYGTEPPRTGRLEDVYAALLQTRGEALTRAVGIIADAAGGTLVHCTVGKDRTGLVVALARLAAGDTTEDVVADYAQSGPNVREQRIEYARKLAERSARTERQHVLRLHLDSPPDAMLYALGIIASHGGAAAYLRAHGLRDEQLRALRRKYAARSEQVHA